MKTLGLQGGCDLSFIFYKPRICWHGQNEVENCADFLDNIHSKEKELKQALYKKKISRFSITWGLKYKFFRDLIQGDICLFVQAGLFLSSLNIFYALTHVFFFPAGIWGGSPGISCANVLDSELFESLSYAKTYFKFHYFSESFLGDCGLLWMLLSMVCTIHLSQSRPCLVLLLMTSCLSSVGLWVTWG